LLRKAFTDAVGVFKDKKRIIAAAKFTLIGGQSASVITRTTPPFSKGVALWSQGRRIKSLLPISRRERMLDVLTG
jgi:hypothetical protein